MAFSLPVSSQSSMLENFIQIAPNSILYVIYVSLKIAKYRPWTVMSKASRVNPLLSSSILDGF